MLNMTRPASAAIQLAGALILFLGILYGMGGRPDIGAIPAIIGVALLVWGGVATRRRLRMELDRESA